MFCHGQMFEFMMRDGTVLILRNASRWMEYLKDKRQLGRSYPFGVNMKKSAVAHTALKQQGVVGTEAHAAAKGLGVHAFG